MRLLAAPSPRYEGGYPLRAGTGDDEIGYLWTRFLGPVSELHYEKKKPLNLSIRVPARMKEGTSNLFCKYIITMRDS